MRYYAWYSYYSQSDVQNQIAAAAQNTVVKHATFDTTATDATGFTGKKAVSGASNAYSFLPQSAGSAVAYAQSAPYSDTDLAARLAEYDAYLTAISEPEEGEDKGEYNGGTARAEELRLSYQESMLKVYGGNSRLTIAAPDGTAYANGVMYVSKHQENGNGDATNQTNEILTNLQMTQIGETYYLSYVTQQDKIETNDIASISRLYLRAFTIADNTATTEDTTDKMVVWGEPYLLRSVVNRSGQREDGVYTAGGAKQSSYQDPYLANLRFLEGKLGDKLKGESETFEPFAEVPSETFLLFEMNGNTYVINEESLLSITGESHTGTISPFFTYQQRYGDALDPNSTVNLSSGKSEVLVGADGDGNVAAVYTASVPNTVNNAIL